MHSAKKLRIRIIKHKLVEMDSYLNEMKEFLPSAKEEFIHASIKKHGIYKLIESAIETIIKICSIINSDLQLGIPSNEESIIQHLQTKKILSDALTLKLIQMKNFRNILVHKYDKIDDSLAFHTIHENLEDFDLFKEEILQFLKDNKNK